MKLIAIDIIEGLLEALKIARSFDQKSFMIAEGQAKPLDEGYREVLNRFYMELSFSNQYFKGGDETYLKKFIDFLRSYFLPRIKTFRDKQLAIGEKYEGEVQRMQASWIEPLLEKGELLLECLQAPKTLFPLLLVPQSSNNKNNGLPHRENLIAIKKATKGLIFGLEEGKKFLEQSQKYISRDLQLKGIGIRYPEKDFNDLLKAAKNFLAGSGVNHLEKLGKFDGKFGLCSKKAARML